jgi:hypothetical protein
VVLDGYARRREYSRSAPPRSRKSVGKDRSVLRVLWRLQTFVCVGGVSANPHIYTSALQALAGRGRTGRLEGGFQGYRGGAMQKLGYELPRNPILRTPLNRGEEGGRGKWPGTCTDLPEPSLRPALRTSHHGGVLREEVGSVRVRGEAGSPVRARRLSLRRPSGPR